MVGQRELISAFAGVPIQEVRGMRAPFLAVKQNFYYMYHRFKILVFVVVPIQEVRGMRAPFLAVKQNFYEKFLFATITDYYRFKILVFVVVPIQEVKGMRGSPNARPIFSSK
jgi:hypothetical protein